MADSSLPLTFGQANGLEDLPSQLSLGQISPHLRASVWAVLYVNLHQQSQYHQMAFETQLKHGWTNILVDYWVNFLHGNIDEFSNEIGKTSALVKNVILKSEYISFLNFIQHVVGHNGCPHLLAEGINEAFVNTRAAYRIINKVVVPITSAEQGDAVSEALTVARSAPAKGPYSHLRSASALLTGGQWADSVRESISAVEGAAKAIEPSGDTLGKALAKLKNSISLNEAMAGAFSKLYGYTSDKQGIRHAQVFDGKADVSERDALFMFGACASFVAYLLSAERDLSSVK